MRAGFTLIIVALAILSLTACSGNQVTTTLQLVVVAAEAAVDTLGSTGSISQDVVQQIDGYLLATSDGVQFATDELASTDAPAVKASKIAQKFAGITAPNLPPGTPQTVLAVVSAVSKAVLTFLSTVQQSQAELVAHPEYATAFAGEPKSKMPKATDKKLKDIKARAERLKHRIKK